jgi:LPXTG-motif cell wall-anchored protein
MKEFIEEVSTAILAYLNSGHWTLTAIGLVSGILSIFGITFSRRRRRELEISVDAIATLMWNLLTGHL